MPYRPQDPELVRRLLRAKDRMAGAPAEDWPVARLAKVSGVSEAHFSRSFKRAFGVPPHRYLLTLRLERAKAMLRDSEEAIVDIGMAAGWNSLGTFGRTFRAVLGLTPTAYRQRARAGMDEGGVVPECIDRASNRPALMIAVLEKRRRDGSE